MDTALREREYISRYWGKAQPVDDQGPLWHPLAYHMLDVGAAAQALLKSRPHSLARAAWLLGLDEQDVFALLPLIAALHDLGKFARAFQSKVPGWAEYGRDIPSCRRHDADGWLIWQGEPGRGDGINEEVSSLIWPKAQIALDTLMMASVAHHGRPVSSSDADENLSRAFGPGDAAARACAKEIIHLLHPHPLAATPPKEKDVRRASFWLAGFITLADWVGSNTKWFCYRSPDCTLDEYWPLTQAAAVKAVTETGLSEAKSAPTKSFMDLTGMKVPPSPMQAWAESVTLPEGPCLILIEDVTGAGKTEAAQMLVHRLMTAGRASGAYWAMPTQATANAMFKRQQSMIRALFAPSAIPRLALAHGEAGLSDLFQATVMRGSGEEAPYSDDEQTATSSCTAFLADDKRAAMVADVGAGTIDQALLGALPVKFNTVRLFGLAQKVLVLDEAHAYDAYVQAETEGLLRFQAALGGSAIVLSATLPKKMREKYVQAWQDGLGIQRTGLANAEYPLTTVVAKSGVIETPVAASPGSHRTVPVRLVHCREDALGEVVAAARKGGAVAWIRNTVDDALAAADELRECGIDPLIFHARFAQCDRQKREHEVMEIFGKNDCAERRGRVLVATQVVEQSLDLDFDCMVSDLAPVDLLIQRAGRLRRHPERVRPANLPLELIVLSPEPMESPPENWIKGLLPGTAAVYRNANILWRTARILAREGGIVTPDCLRALVEYVYDETCETPETLSRAALKSEGENNAARSIGQQNVLKPTHGYGGSQAQWEDERKISTRLIDNQAVVRFAKCDKNGNIVPYANDTEEWKAWALSEVRVRTNRIPADAKPSPSFSNAVERVRAKWKRFERDIPLIVLEPTGDGRWTGAFISPRNRALHRVIYNECSGLGEINQA